MGMPEERAVRAPYSPPGWPLQRGDRVVGYDEWTCLLAEFAEWQGIHAPFWVDTLVFGAQWHSHGTYPAVETEYLGHYPERTTVPPEYWDMEDGPPPHLEGEDPKELARLFFRNWRTTYEGMPEQRRIWTEQRWMAGHVGEETRR